MKLSVELAELLLKKEYRIGLAESCTGGGIAKALTDLPGSSNWFELGVVTYSNDAKEKILGVPKSLLESYGAVSEPVAKAMVEGVAKLSEADVSISVTGIAGPGGGTKEKPVGTVCFGFHNLILGIRVETINFSGDRSSIRHQAVQYALRTVFSDLLQC
tara:strand:- start:465 stop:941 length:477 start_codon:yes stop_codon:yes gene_type:complete